MPLTSKEMIRKLKKHGFEIVSKNGSHVKLVNPDNNITLIVPYHSKELILKQAGIEEE